MIVGLVLLLPAFIFGYHLCSSLEDYCGIIGVSGGLFCGWRTWVNKFVKGLSVRIRVRLGKSASSWMSSGNDG